MSPITSPQPRPLSPPPSPFRPESLKRGAEQLVDTGAEDEESAAAKRLRTDADATPAEVPHTTYLPTVQFHHMHSSSKHALDHAAAARAALTQNAACLRNHLTFLSHARSLPRAPSLSGT